jgi:Protein of unknown function (DUF3800)
MFVFIDESGNHNLNYLNNQDPYYIFVLGGVIFDDLEYSNFDLKFKALKVKFFGTEDFVLHTKEITRPNRSKNDFNLKFSKPEFRQEFYTAISELISETKFKIVVSLIKKKEYVAVKGLDNKDPYIFGMYALIDRIVYHCKGQTCKIFPEKRGHVEDIKLKAEFLSIQVGGTDRFKGSYIDSVIEEFTLKDKAANISGMQLIDLLVTPIGRQYIGLKQKPFGNEIPFELIKSKIADKDMFVYP